MRVRGVISAVCAGVLSLVVCAPAFAAAWDVRLAGDLPQGWTENPDNLWSQAGRQAWEWGSRIQPDANDPEVTAGGQVRVIYFESTGVVDSPEALIKNVNLVDMQLYDATVLDSGKGTFAGYPAYFAKGTVETQDARSGMPKPDGTSYHEHYFVLLPDGAAVRIDGSAGASVEIASEVPRFTTEMQQVLALIEITEGGTAGGGDSRPPAWRTVAGTMAAVAAAAAAIAGAAASRLGRRAKVDPNAPVGYVLQLSEERLAISPTAQSGFTATVWRVLASGAVEPADGAQVTLHAPAGVAAQPRSGPSPLSAGIWQTGDVHESAALGVAAQAPGGGTTATVPLDAEAGSSLTLAFEPAIESIRPTGTHVVHARATLEPSPALAASPDFDAAGARAAITFSSGPGAWVDLGAPAETPDGRIVPVAVSQPDPESPATPPDAVTVTATVQLPTGPLTQHVTLPVERPPVVDVRPERVEFATGSRAQADVLAWVDPARDDGWTFSAAWKQGDRAVATFSVRSEAPGTAVVSLTEATATLPPADTPTEVSTLVVTARHPDWGAVSRHLPVAIAGEGLFVDATGMARDGSFHLLADGSATATEIDVRVFARDASGQVAFSPELSAGVTFEVVSSATEPAGAAWRYGGVEHSDGGTRPSNSPAAIHRFSTPRPLPTAGQPLRVELRAVSTAGPEELFAKPLTVSIVGVDTSPYSAAWETEKANCLRIIDEFVPLEHRAKLTALVHQRGATMGAEGLYAMRTKLWEFARDETMREAHDHLDAAWWNDQVIEVLDWVSWCGDIAMGAATGALAGTAASVALGMLKPTLVSAVQVWVDGGSLSDWASAQVAVFGGALEGAATDVDAINKLAGNKALAWAVFVSYTFVRELMSDPNLSVTAAMKRLAAQMRDEGLVQFLRAMAGRGAKAGAATPGPKAAKGTTEAGATKPAGTKPDAGDAKPGRTDAPQAAPGDSRAVRQLVERVKYRNGKPYADPRDVLAVMRDPEATRSLKNSSDPAVRDAFENTRQEIYAEHDRKLKAYVESRPDMEGKKVVVAEVRTPGKEAGFNTDRDFRVLVETTDPVTGKTVYVEVPTKKWIEQSNTIFAGETGGPTDPAGAKHWAEQHQQLGTDKWHAEAAPDMSDQTFTKGPDGQLVATQGEPRIAAVKDGRGTLIDPASLGQVYQHKVTEQLNTGHTGEAYAQAGKAVRDLGEIRDGYTQQDYQVGTLPERFQTGAEIVRQTGAKGFDDPQAVAAAESALKEAGFKGGLKDFMGALSSQVEALKHARR